VNALGLSLLKKNSSTYYKKKKVNKSTEVPRGRSDVRLPGSTERQCVHLVQSFQKASTDGLQEGGKMRTEKTEEE